MAQMQKRALLARPNKPESSDITELTKQIASIFAEECKRPPWPKDFLCVRLADAILMIRKNPDYDFGREIRILRKRRKIVQDFEHLVNHVQKELDAQFGVYVSAEIQILNELKASSEKAAPILWRDPLPGKKSTASWHRAARTIRDRVKETMIQAGKAADQISFAKGGPLVNVVTEILKLAKIYMSSEAVANALKSLD